MGEGLKQVALYLHCMNKSDRKWLLKNLRRDQRVLLTKMLKELGQLGIPANGALLGQGPLAGADVMGPDEGGASQESMNQYQHTISTIDSASMAQLKKILLSEPDWMVANILSVKRWAWSEQYMGILSSKKRNAINSLCRNAGNGFSDVVKQALVTAFAEKLQQYSFDSSIGTKLRQSDRVA
ncbi:MAG: hypothetical protein OEZ68_07605 [Gammaproteobacteria bacterium]|nr:hypothetical protein [Gammaproteobacteria bacterium]MDH5800650.1 hypothetical protein [Gammaproteobacteria bacterium]